MNGSGKVLRVWKMNGCGNAFAIIDARHTPLFWSPDKIRQVASAFRADQVIAIESALKPKDAFMRIWNADGSEVAACGNATRCVAHLLFEESGAERVVIETKADILKAETADRGHVRVDMGAPLMQWTDIPLAAAADVTAIDLDPPPSIPLPRPAVVSMGNPHCVFFVNDINAIDIETIGAELEHHPMFPLRANIGFAQVLNWRLIRLRVWERGAGLTSACGTGACAALVCAARAGLTDRRARVILDGGELLINWRDRDDHVLMTGPVEMEFEREIPL